MRALKRQLSILLASGLGSGYLPWAPGSWGALVAAVFSWWSFTWPFSWYLVLVTVLFLAGISVVKEADKYFAVQTGQQYDNDQIVIDEWVGMLITLLPFFYFEKNLLYLAVGFLMFRIFDTLKFGLAKIADCWHSRWGVMLDDVFAGVHAAIFFFIALWVMEKL